MNDEILILEEEIKRLEVHLKLIGKIIEELRRKAGCDKRGDNFRHCKLDDW